MLIQKEEITFCPDGHKQIFAQWNSGLFRIINNYIWKPLSNDLCFYCTIFRVWSSRTRKYRSNSYSHNILWKSTADASLLHVTLSLSFNGMCVTFSSKDMVVNQPMNHWTNDVSKEFSSTIYEDIWRVSLLKSHFPFFINSEDTV